jgi:hypothetical protein
MVAGTVAFGAGPAGADGPTYVALGDSYASGDGAPPYEATPNCHRSAGAWARLLADASPSVGPVDLVACGGATTAHLIGPWTQKNLPAQIPASATPATQLVELVTLVIGGNDVGAANMLNTCKALNCPSPTTSGFKTKLATLKATLVTKVYPRMRTAYPTADLVHVGYPQITPGPGATPVNCGWLSKADQTAFTATIDAINATIRDATLEYGGGVRFVDVRDAVLGHEMCTQQPYINPMGSSGFLGIGATSTANTPAHPNLQGQQAIEAVVAASL